MPILSALRNTPCASAPKLFRLVPTSAVAPEYGFHFYPKKDTLEAYAFDNCKYFGKLETVIEPQQLWCHYELLYGYTAGILGQRYYIVPWIALPGEINAELTLEFKVEPYSIYPEDQTKESQKAVRDLIEERNKPQSRLVDLVPEASSGIMAYWKAAGKTTSLKEDKLANGEDARIIIPKGNYIQGNELEKTYGVTIQHGNEKLGKIRITFLKEIKQCICFLQLRKNGGSYEARFLKSNEIPSTYEYHPSSMAVSIADALASYGIRIVTISDIECFDDGNQVLISTDKSLVFSKDLTPDSNSPRDENDRALDEAMKSELFSKIVRYQYKDGQQLINDGAHRVCIVVLVPWVHGKIRLNEGGVAAGVTINSRPTQGLITIPQHFYVFSYVKAFRDEYEARKGTLFENISAGNVIIESVSRGYMTRAAVHELCHALFVRHTFAAIENDETPTSIFEEYRAWAAGVGLSVYGEREADTGTKRNLFPLMRDYDLRRAVVDEYFVAINNEPPSTYAWPKITGLIQMIHPSENVVFIENATNNLLDYTASEIKKQATFNTDGTVTLSFSPNIIHLQLFRYQWELIRGAVQFLAAQS